MSFTPNDENTLLQVMGELTSMTDAPLRWSKEILPVLMDRLGITDLYVWGVLYSGRPKLLHVMDVTGAKLRSQGLISNPKKGYWALTPLGIQYVRNWVGLPHPQDQEPPQEELPELPQTPTGDEEGEEIIFLPEAFTPPFDPSLLDLVFAATPCFGLYDGSVACQSCLIRTPCSEGMIREVESLKTPPQPPVQEPARRGSDHQRIKAIAARDQTCGVCSAHIQKGKDFFFEIVGTDSRIFCPACASIPGFNG